jgi:predicted RNase H-like HicB family nuclease
MNASDYLKLPYQFTIVPDDDGTFMAHVLEFPGCIATGETPAEAITTLFDVAESWLLAMLGSGQAIPEPKGFVLDDAQNAVRVAREATNNG